MVSAREIGTELLERWALGYLGRSAEPPVTGRASSPPLRGRGSAAALPSPCSPAPTRRRLPHSPVTGSGERASGAPALKGGVFRGGAVAVPRLYYDGCGGRLGRV